MTELVVVIPVLNRPDRVEDVLWSLENGRGEVPYRALFVLSLGDLEEREAIEAQDIPFLHVMNPMGDDARSFVVGDPPDALAQAVIVPWTCGPGDWARKINYAFDITTEPFLFTGADDLCWCPGWADRALECAGSHAGVGVIGTNDLSGRRRQHSTHSLVTRAYVDEYGTIDAPGLMLHEGYDHQFVDDELIATATARGLYRYCERSWVEHLHPHWRKGVVDATYRKGQAKFDQDRRLFQRRRRLWASPRSR